jgi:predicted amidohydrolase
VDKFKVAAAQIAVDYRDIERNVATHYRIMRETSDAGCSLVVFPELSVTGHNSTTAILKYAQPLDGPILDAMQIHARECNLIVGYGFCEALRGTHYNAYALVGPDGLLGVQRKVHASHDEFFRFRQAYEWNVIDLGFCRVGVAICHDADFFESWRILALKGAEVILLPHAIRNFASGEGVTTSGSAMREPSDEDLLARQRLLMDSHPLQLLHDIQARSNGVYGVFADQVGYDGNSAHIGGAYVVGPDGALLARSQPSVADLWISAELAPEAFDAARLSPWFALRKRRPEAYEELTRLL